MHRLRSAPSNLPIEIVRTVVAVADTGSFTKAGEKLGLSQPAISAQMKRLQAMVGGLVFERGVGGVVPTDRGQLILPHARRLLQANDQILLLGGTHRENRIVRIGLSRWYVERFLSRYDRQRHGEVQIIASDSKSILKGLTEGYIDLGALVAPPAESGNILAQWQVDVSWVRGRTFTLSPGAPVPLVHWPGYIMDLLGIEALEAKGMAYRIALECPDFLTRMQAVSSGLGVAPWSRHHLWDHLVPAREYYLPALPAVRAGIMARPDFDLSASGPMIEMLSGLGEAKIRDERPSDAENVIGS